MRYCIHMMCVFFVGATLAACNTAEGIGEDVESTGKAIEETAKDTKKKL